VALIGMGKMGRAIRQLAEERGVPVVVTLDRDDPIDDASLAGADVAIEFTEPSAAVANARACVAAGCPVVVGTTGWLDALPAVTADVRAAGGRLLWAANFSLGVNVLLELARAAGGLMRERGFDVHLVETHHAAKRDAPSGTALAIVRSVEPALGRAVPTTSVRTGHVPGTHELIFDGPFEQLRLVHEARDRRVFAEGALAAAMWLAARREPGVYTMRDVLAPAPRGAGDSAEVA
jgi:4-hydroxy-tetrahydrodipicolinate reductase